MTTAAMAPDRTDRPSRAWRSRRQLLLFVVLAYGLSWWPWLGRLVNPESAPVLPVGPSIAALLVVGWVYGGRARRALLRSTVNVRIGRWWWGAAIPLAVAVVVVVLTVLAGAARPSGADLAMAAAGAVITLPVILVIQGPLGEELGWRGYVLPLFLRRHSPVVATVLLIPLWIGFHLPLIVTSPDRFGPWWALTVAGTAFTMTWLHLRTGGSVALAIGFHAVMNVATPAAVGLFADADRLLAMRLTAAVWVLIGVGMVVGPLRRGLGPVRHGDDVPSPARRLRRFARRRPVTAFLALTFGGLGTVLGVPRLVGYSVPPKLLELVLAGLAFTLLFGAALLVTAAADGRPGVHRLLTGLVHWRIGAGRWLLVTTALPVLTLIVAGTTGTLRQPPEGWPQMTVTYLVSGLVVGVVLTNLWEEAAWAGFVQHRLMDRHGLLTGSVLTAMPFTLIHVPGAFQNTGAGEALITVTAIAVLAPFLRYLTGTLLIDTGGSILAVGLLHASFNAAGTMSAAPGGWQFLPALLALALATAAHRTLRRRATPPAGPPRNLAAPAVPTGMVNP
jgi:membrane protease YdiL (CAAX protease family)